MLRDVDLRRIATIADHVESLFEMLSDDEICKVEAMLRFEISYQAAIAQSRCVEPPNGWDPCGRR